MERRVRVIPTRFFGHIKDSHLNPTKSLLPTYSDRVQAVCIQGSGEVYVRHNFNSGRSGVFYGEGINDANIFVRAKIDGKNRRLYFHYE